MKPQLVVWDQLSGVQHQERTYLVRAIGEGVNATIKVLHEYESVVYMNQTIKVYVNQWHQH